MASTDDKPEAKHVAAPAADDVSLAVSDAPPPAASEKGAAPPPPPPAELKTETPRSYVVVAEVVLRVLLFVGTVTAVVVMVTSKETELVPIPFPPFRILNSSRFTDSPAFVYFVAALSVAGLYSIISTLATGLALLKPGSYKQLVSHFVVIDVLLLGIVAAATGAAAGVAYIGLKGNSHSRWNKICNRYDTFCQHLAGSIAASLFASIVLVLLILLSVFTLSRKKRD